MLKDGVIINDLDLVLKKMLMRLCQDSSRIQMLAYNQMIYSSQIEGEKG